MATPQFALVSLGLLAVFTGYFGLFKRFGDTYTPVLFQFASAVLWGVFGVANLDAVTHSSGCCVEAGPIWSLVVLGVALSVVMGLFALNELFGALRGSTQNVDLETGVR